MGRLPTHFATRPISFRVPYTMPGELVVAAATTGVQFPDATYLHSSDKPFEIHRVIPRVTALTAAALPYVPVAPQTPLDLQYLCETLMRIRIHDVSKNENLTKNMQILTTLTKGHSEKTWEWSEPYTIERSEGFQVTVDNLATAAIVGGVYAQTRLELSFQGFLIVVAAPSERR